jgi:transglutaminase-like putative cysteine protease
VGTRPAPTFAALSTRGDWMLDGRQGPQVDAARRFLLRAADRLEWLYLAVHEDEFARKGDKDKDQGKDTPPPLPTSSATPTPVPVPTTRPDPSSTDHPRPSGGGTSPETTWPVGARIHPAVASMPPDAEKSIASVARYIADRDSTPAGRLKAAHDWVADRIAYDAPSYAAHVYPPQDAQAVFDRRVGVCAGYAQLLAALGKALGLEVAYVTGDARTDGMRETGEGHAWNAARVDGRYFLIDATWDSGTIDSPKFEKHYRTDYYLTPPDVFSVDHFPSDERWQLRKTPLSRGDFFRQPMMTPAFHAEHRELISPTRSQVTVHGPVEILMRAPPTLFTTAAWIRRGSHEQTHCAITRGEVTRVQCDLPAAGAYSVVLFSNTEEYGSYHYIVQIEATRED